MLNCPNEVAPDLELVEGFGGCEEFDLAGLIQDVKNRIRGVQAEMRNLRRQVVLESRHLPARERRAFVDEQLNSRRSPTARRMSVLNFQLEIGQRLLEKLQELQRNQNRR